ncbi:hypothetical protein ACWDUL_15945 [Nocardia niigatensis]|uniref:hypothetical protein n=1 Tax=Nocardia niigatensis TaxID=209249 RepID=UPI000594E41A|nr:hypothetical protein [Nocardia niigatensis]
MSQHSKGKKSGKQAAGRREQYGQSMQGQQMQGRDMPEDQESDHLAAAGSGRREKKSRGR